MNQEINQLTNQAMDKTIYDLPIEILSYILEYLDINSLLSAQLVSKRFHFVINHYLRIPNLTIYYDHCDNPYRVFDIQEIFNTNVLRASKCIDMISKPNLMKTILDKLKVLLTRLQNGIEFLN